MGTIESIVLQNAYWALPIVSDYLNYDDIITLSRDSSYIKKLLNTILEQKRTYDSSDFIRMLSDKIMHVRTLCWSDAHDINNYKLPPKLETLYFNNITGQPIYFDRFPQSLTRLIIVGNFNQPI